MMNTILKLGFEFWAGLKWSQDGKNPWKENNSSIGTQCAEYTDWDASVRYRKGKTYLYGLKGAKDNLGTKGGQAHWRNIDSRRFKFHLRY